MEPFSLVTDRVVTRLTKQLGKPSSPCRPRRDLTEQATRPESESAGGSRPIPQSAEVLPSGRTPALSDFRRVACSVRSRLGRQGEDGLPSCFVSRGHYLSVTRERGFHGESAPERSKGKYGVKLIRGPFVQLAPHSEECEDEKSLPGLRARLHAEGHR